VAQRRITCSACHQLLTVRRSVKDPWLTCPHCLTQVMNPDQAVQATPPASLSVPSPNETNSTCEGCGETVDPGWAYCPHCNKRLRRERLREVAHEKAEVDVEVKRDARATVIGLVVFLPIIAVAAIYFFSSGGIQLTGASPEGGTILLLTVVVVVGLVVGLIALMTRSKSTEAKVLYGVLGGLSITVTITVGFILLVLAAISAACANCGQPRRR
jgi:hypothetical protein